MSEVGVVVPKVGTLVPNGGRDNSGRPTPPAVNPAVNYDAIFENIQGSTNQIPGIASDITDIGQDTYKLLQQGYGLGRGLTNIGSAVGETLEGQTGIAGQLTDQDSFLRNTINPNIVGLYGKTGELQRGQAGLSGQIGGLGTDISGQTTALERYISEQIGNVTANQALQDTSLKNILGNVGEGGTLANQLTTRANTLDQGIEGLQTTGDTAARSLVGLLEGQDTLGGNIGGLATDFGGFREQYTDDQADARTFRTDTRASILGGQQQIQDAMGGNLGQRIDQVARNVDRQRTDQQQDFAGVARLIAANAPPQTQQDLVERGRFRESLDKIRSAIQSNPNIDQGTRDTYSALTNSFDANGKLNAVSVKQDGGLISRSFDDQGQVVINQLGPQGEDMGGSPLSLNVNQLLNNAAGGAQQQQQLPAASIGQVSNDSERFNRPNQLPGLMQR